MKAEIKDTGIELTITCSKIELDHFARGLRDSSIEDDAEDCDCREEGCYECNGYTNYREMKKIIMLRAGLVKLARKKSPKKFTEAVNCSDDYDL